MSPRHDTRQPSMRSLEFRAPEPDGQQHPLMADQRPICSSKRDIQREEAGTAGIRQISTLSGQMRMSAYGKQNGSGRREILIYGVVNFGRRFHPEPSQNCTQVHSLYP
jgi:hypothetical protein